MPIHEELSLIYSVICSSLCTNGQGKYSSLRLVLFGIGLWWFVFSIPAVLWLRPRPGPPIKKKSKNRTLSYIIHGWSALGKTLVRARRLHDLLTFLVAWFFLSDAIAIVSGTAILFAKISLGMAPASFSMINIVVILSGVARTLLRNRVLRFSNLRPSQTVVVACIFISELIPLFALLGYIPAAKRLGFISLQQPSEKYPVGFVYGTVIAGISSHCRSLFDELVPPGFEASRFSIKDKKDQLSLVFLS